MISRRARVLILGAVAVVILAVIAIQRLHFLPAGCGSRRVECAPPPSPEQREAYRKRRERQAVADSIAFTEGSLREGGGKWTVATNGDSARLGESPVILLSLRAEQVATGWLATHRPVLVVRCVQRGTETEVLVLHTGLMSSGEEGPWAEPRVTLQFDAFVPSEEDWLEAHDVSGEAPNNLVFEVLDADAEYLAINLAQSRRFHFEVTPLHAPPDSKPVVATFDVRGLAQHLPEIARACQWTSDWRRAMYEGAAERSARVEEH